VLFISSLSYLYFLFCLSNILLIFYCSIYYFIAASFFSLFTSFAFSFFSKNAYRNIYAIISANSPIASVYANPSIADENSSCFYEGFLDVPCIYAANIYPIPTAAPPYAIVAYPAPIYFAAIYIFLFSFFFSFFFSFLFFFLLFFYSFFSLLYIVYY
jgi:hypothetical protein